MKPIYRSLRSEAESFLEGKTTSETMGLTLCPNCGAEVMQTDRFCSNCGYRLR